MVWVFSISLGILYRFITTLTKYQRISNSELVQNWTSIGLELEVDWTCFEEKAGPSQPDTYSDIINIGLPLKVGCSKLNFNMRQFYKDIPLLISVIRDKNSLVGHQYEHYQGCC